MIDENVQSLVKEMMANPSAEIELFRGMEKISGEFGGNGTAEFKPTNGRTVVIKIHGGANNVEVNRVKIPGEG